MILVADSGSTKCDWVLTDTDGQYIHKTKTEGINPLLFSEDNILKIINKTDFMNRKNDLIKDIHFYGAGCGTNESKQKIKDLLKSVFKNTDHISVEEDIIAAVHATTQDPGIICILGTGANCCYYDGTKVIQKSPALGYLLADEGSGNYLGKELIKDYFLDKMPIDLAISFKQEFLNDLDQLLKKLYSTSYPNTYLATYAKFVFQNRGHQYAEELLHKGISKFITTQLSQYKKELSEHPVHFVGSVAYYSQDIIKQVLDEYGYRVKSFIKNPIDHLIHYTINQKV
ncbi:BadF/BadG/BcrA/BcrD ATPase family protein [Aquimarina sp. 2201CG5-10]|uniref:BadF/BadG/BcrA/BcrD ATPase family protein n=1 Tax=Aquimarina callyspongiae TaxID=3098150 RepID=UPI002AB3B855|nr:BadF/BadG/BcrA/BcrD ATPase family protein [Aquimarina sp. 2201CG5-10]MDY8135140.1 N-acetylglucosamine kinase [Aquimarina sp. 2201CG5-10]